MKDIEKIYKVLEIRGIAPTKAERLLGLSQGTLTKSWDRRGNVHNSTRHKFVAYFDVNEKWWLTGEGEIFKTKDDKGTDVPNNPSLQEISHLIHQFNDVMDGLRHDIDQLKQDKLLCEEKLKRYERGN